ncbi:MAG: ABC transporter ATP-binding protein/permease [Lachnospiraceae bacterium]|nr:ABC transporter ATP-binding protein/permease [Lachnospiraceae bacterium]
MLKTILAEVKEYKFASIMTPIVMLGEVLMETLIPLVMGMIVNVGILKSDMNMVYKLGAVMVVLAALSLTFGALGAKFGAEASMGFGKNLRKKMYENIQTFSFSNIDKFSTAGLVTRLTTDVTNIQNAYQMVLKMCMRAPASLICAMALSFYVNKKIASIYLVAVVLLGCVLFLLIKKTMKYFNEVFRKYDDLNASVQENISGIRVVKAYVREDYENEKFKKAAYNVYKLFLRAEKMIVINMPLMQLTVYSCIMLISWVGAKMIVGNTLRIGDLSTLLAYCMNILMSLMMLSFIFVMITMSIASGERVAEVINEKADIVNPENPLFEVKDGSIEFKNVSFKYNKEAEDSVLKDINLKIESGQTIGIIGGTGSAKTSLVNLISRLYDATEGEVIVGGENVKNYDLESLRDEVSQVLQNNVLFSGSIIDNLRWGKEDATEEECIKAAELACASEFIEKMPDKYETHIEQGGTNVSGGQKQRLCIARALIKNPKVLILDDSTSAVDTATDAKIREAFRKHIPSCTKIIIAQRISSVQDADKIIVMHEGEINAFDTHEKLLETNEIYRDVYESQTSGSGDFDID